MFFILPFENSPLSSFCPDDRKWSPGEMEEVAASVEEGLVAGAAAKKTVVSGVD